MSFHIAPSSTMQGTEGSRVNEPTTAFERRSRHLERCSRAALPAHPLDWRRRG